MRGSSPGPVAGICGQRPVGRQTGVAEHRRGVADGVEEPVELPAGRPVQQPPGQRDRLGRSLHARAQVQIGRGLEQPDQVPVGVVDRPDAVVERLQDGLGELDRLGGEPGCQQRVDLVDHRADVMAHAYASRSCT